MAAAEGLALAPWGALGGGHFKSEAARQAGDGGRKTAASDAQVAVSRVLEKIAQARGTAITSVALAYVMHKAPFVFPIVGGRKVEHLKSNIEGLALALSAEEIAEIEAAVPFDLGFPHNMLWGAKAPAIPQQVGLLNMGGTFDYVAGAQVCILSAIADGFYSVDDGTDVGQPIAPHQGGE